MYFLSLGTFSFRYFRMHSQPDHEINLCPRAIRSWPLAQNFSSKGKTVLKTLDDMSISNC